MHSHHKNINFKVSPTFHADVKSTAARHGLTMTAFLHLAFGLAKRHLTAKAGVQ